MSEQLFELCKEAAKSVGNQLGMGFDDIEDAAASVYLRCRNRQVDHNAYVYTATRNWFIDVIRARETVREVPYKDFSRYQGVPINHNDTNGYFDEIEVAKIKSELLERLTPGQQDAMIVHLAGFTDREACIMLGITKPSYKTHLRRGRKKLAQMMGVTLKKRKKTEE